MNARANAKIRNNDISKRADLIDVIAWVHLDPSFEFEMRGLITITPSEYMELPHISAHNDIHILPSMKCIEPNEIVNYYPHMLFHDDELKKYLNECNMSIFCPGKNKMIVLISLHG